MSRIVLNAVAVRAYGSKLQEVSTQFPGSDQVRSAGSHLSQYDGSSKKPLRAARRQFSDAALVVANSPHNPVNTNDAELLKGAATDVEGFTSDESGDGCFMKLAAQIRTQSTVTQQIDGNDVIDALDAPIAMALITPPAKRTYERAMAGAGASSTQG